MTTTTTPSDPVQTPGSGSDFFGADEDLVAWLTGNDEEIAAITPEEHRAALDRILTAAGYARGAHGHLYRIVGADHE